MMQRGDLKVHETMPVSKETATNMITDQTITAALRPGLSLTESVNILLEADRIKSGTKVAVLDGTAYGIDGIQGTAKGPSSNKGAGFIDVELPNKMIVPIAANLLLPV